MIGTKTREMNLQSIKTESFTKYVLWAVIIAVAIILIKKFRQLFGGNTETDLLNQASEEITKDATNVSNKEVKETMKKAKITTTKSKEICQFLNDSPDEVDQIESWFQNCTFDDMMLIYYTFGTVKMSLLPFYHNCHASQLDILIGNYQSCNLLQYMKLQNYTDEHKDQLRPFLTMIDPTFNY